MDKGTKDYLKQHVWNIIQCVLGAGCFALEWMAYRNYQGIQTGAAPAVPAGAGMTPHYFMPWYLWAGIAALSLSVIIPAILGMLRKTKPSTFNPQVVTFVSPPAARTFVNLPVKELLGFYEGRSGIQADKLIAPYKGSWISAEGEITLLLPDNVGFVAVLRDADGKTIEARFPDKTYEEALSPLAKGIIMRVNGKIADHQNGSQLYLQACEFVRSYEHIMESGPPPWQGYESEQAWRDAIAEQNRLVMIGHSVDRLFSPLQVEAFSVAKDAIALAASKPRPVFNPKDYGANEDGKFHVNDWQEMARFTHMEMTAINQWRHEVRAKYTLSDLQSRATKLYHRFVDEAHILDHHLASLVDSADTDDALIDMAATVRRLAFQLEDMKP